MWDEIAAAVWLDPTLVTDRESLYVDFNSDFGPGYGDTLSWREHYQPGLGEQKTEIVRSVDVKRMEALMVSLIGRRGVPGK
jgi:inosine-uridine nucleoside N-ribohydrolase